MPKDFYEILGVNKNATDEEIKRSYRKLAQKHHPDRNKGDKGAEDKFKEVNSAYEILSDKKKRQTYDQFGASDAQGARGAGGFDFSQFSGFGGGFADIFESFFGGEGGQKRQGHDRGEDIQTDMELTFEEAAFGVEKEFRYQKVDLCEVCNGNGAKPRTKIVPCSTCGGTGEIRQIQHTILGQMVSRRVCPKCAGEGKVPEHPCESCKGSGRKRQSVDLKVKLPLGIDTGQVIRLAGKGNAGYRGGRAGDFFIRINVIPSAKFRRKGADTYSEAKIHILQAILGSEIDIETIHGNVKLKIPPGTEPGKTFRLTEYGVPQGKLTSRGNHFVKILVKMPQKLSKQEHELYLQLAKSAGIQPSEIEKGFFGKLF